MANGIAKHVARDVYGFRLTCTPEEEQIRQQCEQRQAQQLQAWEKYWKRRRLPKDEKLKKLCRKVRLPAYETLLLLLKAKIRSLTAIGACWALPTYTSISMSPTLRAHTAITSNEVSQFERQRVGPFSNGRASRWSCGRGCGWRCPKRPKESPATLLATSRPCCRGGRCPQSVPTK